MAIVYKIHPAIGIARVGDSEEYYLGPETAGGLPILPSGAPFGPDDFRDAQGRIRRQAARFRVYVYDDADPDDPGREVVVGENYVTGIEWRVHVANKKPIWYQFHTLLGEDGYAPDHPLRNPLDTDPASRVKRIIDPGPRTLTGANCSVTFARGDDTGYPATWPPKGLKPHDIDSLGQAHTDAQGRLIFVGGYGNSGSSVTPGIVDYANNDDWWDDTCDGTVTATVLAQVAGYDARIDVDFPAWVAVAPPKFAPQLFNLVTLYDTMYDVAVRRFGRRPDIYRDQAWQTDYRPDYASEIEPLLKRGMAYPWVAAIPPHAHKFDTARLGDPDPAYLGLRQFIVSILRPPTGPDYFGAPASGLTMMPFLAGDNAFYPGAPTSSYLKLSDTQYFLLQQWANGNFDATARTPPAKPGEELDRAVLENCVGGGFSPGIEMTWIVRNPAIYREPFRLKHKAQVPTPLSLTSALSAGLEPGDGCKYMAVPWQADYNECSSQEVIQPRALGEDPVPGNQVVTRVLWWWPAQRPGFVWVRDETAPLGRRQRPWLGSHDPNDADYIQFADDLEMVERWNELGFLYDFGTDGKPEILEVGDRTHQPKSDD